MWVFVIEIHNGYLLKDISLIVLNICNKVILKIVNLLIKNSLILTKCLIQHFNIYYISKIIILNFQIMSHYCMIKKLISKYSVYHTNFGFNQYDETIYLYRRRY